MIYVIDHKDSFTHNVVHQLSLFDEVECDNYNNVDKIKLNKAKVIVFSPGPGNPKNYPLTSKIYNQFKGKKKIIGICLGFQQILFCEGAHIVEQNKIYHGYQSNIKVNSKNSLFKPLISCKWVSGIFLPAERSDLLPDGKEPNKTKRFFSIISSSLYE